jgi:hypothetical protein
MVGVRRSRATVLLDLWVLVLASALCLPALTHAGLGLSGDLVFSPRQPLTLDTVGLGARVPRAVPLDAVVALIETIISGEMLFRVAVLAGLVLAGWGAHRLARGCSLAARFAAATFAIWNPYVVERLALGQWALLLAYGALFFVVHAALRARSDPERSRCGASHPWQIWAWVGLASLTPTGGVLATVLAVALTVSSSGPRRARMAVVGLGCAVLQLPWVLPSLLGAGTGVGDATGVGAFRAQPDAPGGTLVSLLGLGGIWDLESVPTSRTSLLGLISAAVVVAALVGAWRRLPAGAAPLVWVAAGGLLLALAPRLPVAADVMRWAVVHVPGGGLLRDSQKWIAPVVVLATLSLAVGLDRLRAWLARRDSGLGAVVAGIAIVLPLVLLPDAASKTWDAVRPVSYPADFAEIEDLLARSSDSEAMVLLPWRSYRRFDWGNRRTVHDPAYAWFDVPMIGSDELVVGRRTVGDHDHLAEAVRRAASGPEPARQLARLGVRWALVYTDDPLTPTLRLDGLERVAGGSHVQLWRVPGAVTRLEPVATWRRAVVLTTDVVVLLGWLVSCVMASRRRFAATLHLVVRRRSRNEVG